MRNHMASIAPLFSTQQLQYLSEVYGINPLTDVLHGGDGLIIKGKTKTVWYKDKSGPREVDVERAWNVLKTHSEEYFLMKPTGKFVYD